MNLLNRRRPSSPARSFRTSPVGAENAQKRSYFACGHSRLNLRRVLGSGFACGRLPPHGPNPRSSSLERRRVQVTCVHIPRTLHPIARTTLYLPTSHPQHSCSGLDNPCEPRACKIMHARVLTPNPMLCTC